MDAACTTRVTKRLSCFLRIAILAPLCLKPQTSQATITAMPKQASRAERAQIEKRIDVEVVGKSLHLDEHRLGDTVEEQEYRRHMLHEGLFLNPLNDLGFHSIAAQDIFVLPTFTTGLDEPPTLIGLFNQMKQEFISARWLLYDGMAADTLHFADRDVVLYNTLDYPSYSIAVEKVKAAFRMGYALFDKIAFFVNDYWKLGVNPRSVYFKTIWYEDQNARAGVVRSKFANSQNWPLRGLFWLSKDIFDPELQETAEPDAQELYTIRNCLEHTYLKVHEMLVPRGGPDIFNDRLAYSIQRESFYRKTYRVLRLARAGMIYLSLAMHHEKNGTNRAGEWDSRSHASRSLAGRMEVMTTAPRRLRAPNVCQGRSSPPIRHF